MELAAEELPAEVDRLAAELPADTAELRVDMVEHSADMARVDMAEHSGEMVEHSADMAATAVLAAMVELWESVNLPIAARSEPTVKSEIHYFGLKILEPVLPTDIRRA